MNRSGTALLLVLACVAALTACVVPFVIPDLLKIALAVLVSRRVGKYLK